MIELSLDLPEPASIRVGVIAASLSFSLNR